MLIKLITMAKGYTLRSVFYNYLIVLASHRF